MNDDAGPSISSQCHPVEDRLSTMAWMISLVVWSSVDQGCKSVRRAGSSIATGPLHRKHHCLGKPPVSRVFCEVVLLLPGELRDQSPGILTPCNPALYGVFLCRRSQVPVIPRGVDWTKQSVVPWSGLLQSLNAAIGCSQNRLT